MKPLELSPEDFRTLAAEGMVIVKFWMHISDEEQLRRFERHPNLDDWLARVDTPSDDAEVIRALLREHVEDGVLRLSSIVVQAGRAG